MFKIRLKKNTEKSNRQVKQRFERKFFVTPEKTDFARTLVSHLCLPDSDYPQNRINSLYFDTSDLSEFHKSDEGEYKREKVRIRWYDDSCKQHGMVPVWLELKYKRGFASKKQRRKFLVPAEKLCNFKDGDTIIDGNMILQTLSEFGHFPEDFLLPVVLITYKRFRFTEIMTGTRLSFDWEISSSLAASWLGYSEADLALEGGIIEIKGPSMQIPQSLHSLTCLGIDWSRFSKYAGCLGSHIEQPGSVGRFWPSGRVELL